VKAWILTCFYLPAEEILQMAAHNLQLIESPTKQEAEIAAQGSRQLAAILGKGETARLRIIDGDIDVIVPMSAVQMLVQILDQMAKGNAVSMVPIHAELTTQEAADFLNVSRPFLVKLLEEGEMAFRKVGVRRRILFKDLMEYRENSMVKKNKSLDALAAQAQELGMGY
jgi:excisionase family DNA binding protein